ncbi:heat shock protein 90 : Chaperone protein HtpG OS=Pelobacter propionicus (strain DSM 2379) GN=htpG PE=3 SV=1: HATPase_c_3: HSP90 [Gemmataceae bacterium]|nr:heat shock protein 90 : Chaperone protein HtpG OS=Pelobacter propionicus (strain DSM 2379) GN=htpG PE=3 SV=1: HATPase_c_3: HSP90 [Gemmataceae bacterium]VTU01310.1 heat shock protein 90 : Chaperone protein HtpG OS=Pelobacter propionicus (strain DSM 2379) GN=htpG PE=3 SV=1: HATPase_c_3: HSP90 [Gemmataceae bacterium]
MAETLEFKAELKQLLHLITHSLYSDREIFLRELISNASDAINKVRFDSLSNADKMEGNTDWKIKLTPDAEKNTLTISDNGVGMSRAEVIENLGTVAQSGTKAFLEAAKQAGKAAETPGLIGQFGVGFYSAFMVADTVTVVTRPLGSTPSDGTRWVSDGQGQYTLEATEKPGRGTDITLHLKDDAKEFLEPYHLRSLVRKFSDFLEFPVVMDSEKEVDGKKEVTEETLNSRKAIWLRKKNEVKPEEYAEFYKSLSHDSDPPAEVIHYAAEGKTEFRVLAFVPEKKPFAFDWQEPVAGLRLYVQRVLIMEQCEQVLPSYLRFVKGVVDSSDLPLNVSRELLQQNPLLDAIQKSVVKNVLDTLAGMKNIEYDKYLTFYKGFGPTLKEGLSRDWSNREKIADLLLFESANTEAGKFTTLADYVAKMPADQSDIYYLTGETAEQLRKSPYLEAFRAKGRDVLLLTDPVDEFTLPSLGTYKGKQLKAADRGDTATGEEVPAGTKEQFAGVVAYLKEKLPEVADVRLTTRLTESAACLVADAGAVNAHLERMMEKMGRDTGANKRVLELNPANAAVVALRDRHAANAADPRLEGYARLLYEQSLIAEGSSVPDPVAFAKRVNDLIARDAG